MNLGTSSAAELRIMIVAAMEEIYDAEAMCYNTGYVVSSGSNIFSNPEGGIIDNRT
jgi:hypothetical protein